MSGPVDPKVPDENILAASRALEVIGLILEDEAIPERTRAVLESMGPEGLKQLGRFGAALLADGMWFEVPGVGRCFIK